MGELRVREDGFGQQGGTPVPSNVVLPSRVRNSSLGSPNHHFPWPSPGSPRSITSEKTPWVGSPIRVVGAGRSIMAWVNVSPALNVDPPVSSATGPA